MKNQGTEKDPGESRKQQPYSIEIRRIIDMKRKTEGAAKAVILFFALMLMACLFSGHADAASGKKTLNVSSSQTAAAEKAAKQLRKQTGAKVTIKIGKKNVTKETYSLTKGDKATLKVNISGWSGKKKITYKSSVKKIASVTAKGVVKARKTGTAKIKVTVKGGQKSVSAWVKIKVVKKRPAKPEQPDTSGSEGNSTPETETPGGNGSEDNNTPETEAPGGSGSEDDNTSETEMPEDKPGTGTSDKGMKAKFNFKTKTVKLNSGYEMPINGLGTYSLHGEECINAVKSALASGVRLIDTASAYGNEEEVGQAIRESIEEGIVKREDVFVITKIYPGSEMASPKKSIQACLDRLDIGYVDMMLLHHPDRNDVKAYKAIEEFVKDGKIRSIGLSNWYVKELTEFLPQVDTTPALVQNEIHPYYQENDVIPFIQDLGIVVQGWYPLGGRGYTAELLGDSEISAIAKDHGVSSAQVILRWNLQKGVVVIPGSSNPDHIKENAELYHFSLTEDEMSRINALDRGEKHDWY